MKQEGKQVRVAIVFSASDLGGAEISLTRMAIAEKTDIYFYSLWTVGGEGDWYRWVTSLERDANVFDVRLLSICTLHRFIAALRASRPQIIYVIGLKAAAIVRVLRWRLGPAKIVHGIRTSLPPATPLTRRYRWSEKLMRRATDAYIANSASGVRTLRQQVNLPPERVFCIVNGIDVAGSRDSLQPDKICVLANLHALKGHCEFLRVVRRVVQQHSSARFIFAGRDDLGGKVQHMARDMGILGNCEFLGYVDDVRGVLAASTMLVLPSRITEGGPTSILEAHAAAIPVVAFSVGGVPELVRDGLDGLLCPATDDEMMSNHILRLLRDPELCLRMGQAGQARVRAENSLERMAFEHTCVWDRLIKVERNQVTTK